MRQAALPVERLRVSGRLTRRGEFLALLAELGGCVVEVAGAEESGLEGVARLALAVSLGEDAPLVAAAETRSRYEPCWNDSRRSAARSRWLAAIDR
jgi:glycerol kinase